MTNYTFLVKWKNPDNISHTVGALSKDNNMYYFRYNSNKALLDEAKAKGFKWVPTFWDENKIYASKELFDFFKSRLPKETNGKIEEDLFAEDLGVSFTDHYFLEKI